MAIISTFKAVTNSLDVGITESSSDRGGRVEATSPLLSCVNHKFCNKARRLLIGGLTR